MTVEDILNIDNIDELHKIIIHHEVEIEELKKQNNLLQMENTSLNGFYNSQKEFNETHFTLDSNDAKTIYSYLNKHADNQFRGRSVYANLANFVRDITGKENERDCNE